MYVNPLDEEGLFLLNPEQAPPSDDDAAYDSLKTERDLSFEFKRDVDYFAKFDALMPKWENRRYETANLPNLSGTALFTAKGAPEVKIAKRRTVTTSLRMYVRAIDPAGNLCPLHISTVTPSPEYPDGHDKLGTPQRVVTEKSRKGWLVVENVDTFWSTFAGRRGQEYAAWCWAVMAHRKAKHAAHELAERPQHMGFLEKQMKQQTEAMRQMGTEIGQAVARTVVDSMAAQQRPAPVGKREKTE